MMYEDEFVNRLAILRLEKGVSARDMSLSIGQNPSYINSIESGKALPSMSAFFFICDYLGITPKEFFSTEQASPEKLRYIVPKIEHLSSKQLELLSQILDEFNK